MNSKSRMFDKSEVPEHLFCIPQLDFSEDVFAQPITTQWSRIGVWTNNSDRRIQDVNDVIERYSFLVPTADFNSIYDCIDSVGNVLRSFGKPTAWTSEEQGTKSYRYLPFHRFEIDSIIVEPLVFTRGTKNGVELFINPDLWLFFELEEISPGSGIWWDPPKGVEVLRNHVVDDLRVVDIRIDYLQNYLRARQLSLVIGHYRHLNLHSPSEAMVKSFVSGDVVLGSVDRKVKAIFQNFQNFIGLDRSLIRRLHLWYQLEPEPIDLDAPWAENPPFNAFEFTFPTSSGLVAPARWKSFRGDDRGQFAGVTCNFMDRIYFKQEVLSKYEGAAGYIVGDNGSVSCYNEWGLVRSTMRIGNELISTSIGDFAEGVAFEEWPHWKQYTVEPPDNECYKFLVSEQPIAQAVNVVESALRELNSTFSELSRSLGVHCADSLWNGSLDSLAGRQLKWVYPLTANDDEFLKRATLLSTFVLDELDAKVLRRVLGRINPRLKMNNDNPPKPMGSRNLLHRLVLSAVIFEELQAEPSILCSLVLGAEGKSDENIEIELLNELQLLNEHLRKDIAALAFLYDLRNAGGIAHPLNQQRVSDAALKLGIPGKGWNRKDYLRVLSMVASSVQKVSEYFEQASTRVFNLI